MVPPRCETRVVGNFLTKTDAFGPDKGGPTAPRTESTQAPKTEGKSNLRARGLDKDLKKIVRLETATLAAGRGIAGLGLGFLFLIGVLIFTALQSGSADQSLFLIVAGVLGGYMALNIGANDVANNVGPAVGSRALTLVGALAIAAIFEAAGAIIAGGDVVATISKGIIDPSAISEPETFVWAMGAALLAAALWLNLATYVGAPVSTTHSIVGGVLGAGVAAIGIQAVHWPTMSKIAASWVISPVLGGLIAAAFFAFVKANILDKNDRIAAARRWIPVLVSVMATAFSVYLVMKGLKRVWKPDAWVIVAIGGLAFAATYTIVKPMVVRASVNLENRRKAVSGLFTVPLICSAALLSFAHGSNDVANAVGPLAAIVGVVSTGEIATNVEIPLWVMVIGATGIALGLFLFGPKLIRTVGEKITRLDRARAFCVALSAALTVIAASALGLPVSSTHIAVGAIFGVGFFREISANRGRAQLPSRDESELPPAKLKRKLEKRRRRQLVRRSHLLTIVAAWLITVPCAAFLAGALYAGISAIAQP